jgi:hypothetical protein
MGELPEQKQDEDGEKVHEPEPDDDSYNAQPPKRRSNRAVHLGLLSLIMMLGISLRFWGIGWSLPDQRHPQSTYHPDELVNYEATQYVNVLAGKFDIGYYNYGTFYFYLVDVAQMIGHSYGAIPSTPARSADSSPLPPIEEAIRKLPETRGVYLAGRVVSAVMGVLTIPVLFALGRRLYGEAAGLISALVYAVLPLAVVNAHFYTVDVSAALFVALALLWSARLLESQSWQNYLLAGFWTGLAAATKYTTGLVIVAPITAHLLVMARSGKSKTPLTGPAMLLAATAISFLIACPGPLINWTAFWDGLPSWPNSGVRYELLEHPRLGHGLLFVNTGPGWWYHLIVSLRYGLGLPMLAFVAVGILMAIRMRTESDRLLLWFVLLFYGVTGLSAVRFARYLIPLYPAFCVLAGRVVLELKPGSKKVYVGRGAIALAILLTAAYSATLVRTMALKDPRDAAADYLEARAAQGASVAFAKTPWYFSPPLSPWFGETSARNRAKCTESSRFRFVLPAAQSEYDAGVLTPLPDYLVISNIETINELRLNLSAPKKFLSSIPGSYKQIVFAPHSIFNMAFASTSSGQVPDDLLYILPRITVYEKP